MRQIFIFILAILLGGCFEDQPQLPQLSAKQDIEVTEDLMVCFSGYEDFSHFNLNCATPFDSVHWYAHGGNSSTYLGNGNPQQLSVTAYQYASIQCFGFSAADTTYYTLELNYCGRHIYIPTAFSPVYNNGLNDVWKPVVNTSETPYSIHIEIRTLDGIKIFETNSINVGWDGVYNGYLVPRGAYLYHIELTVEGEETVIYTGWIEMLG